MFDSSYVPSIFGSLLPFLDMEDKSNLFWQMENNTVSQMLKIN